jgi:transcriptional regulator with XRE-family HTH domain
MPGFTYKSYSFVDKDPMIDQVRTIILDSTMTYKTLADASGVAEGTIRNWLDGATRKPQAATFNAVLRACGYKLTIRKITEQETVLSTTSVRHIVQMAKYRRTRHGKA